MSAAETAKRVGEIRERAEFVPPMDFGSGPQIAAWAASAADVPDLLYLVGALRSTLAKVARNYLEFQIAQLEQGGHLTPDEAAVLRWALGES